MLITGTKRESSRPKKAAVFRPPSGVVVWTESYAVLKDHCKLVEVGGFLVDELVDQPLAKTRRDDLVPSTGFGRVQSVVGLFDEVFRNVL